MSFLQFTETPDANQEKKTKTWNLESRSKVYLGYVKWYSPWRRYVFYPQPEVLFDAACLEEIGQFLANVTNQQKETWK